MLWGREACSQAQPRLPQGYGQLWWGFSRILWKTSLKAKFRRGVALGQAICLHIQGLGHTSSTTRKKKKTSKLPSPKSLTVLQTACLLHSISVRSPHPPSFLTWLLFLMLGGDDSDQTGRGSCPFTGQQNLYPQISRKLGSGHIDIQHQALLFPCWPLYHWCGQASSGLVCCPGTDTC